MFGITTAILQARAAVNVRNNDGDTALTVAVRSGWGSANRLAVLLQHRADPNVANGAGDTALLLAARAHDAAVAAEEMYTIHPVLTTLVMYGGDITKTNMGKGLSDFSWYEEVKGALLEAQTRAVGTAETKSETTSTRIALSKNTPNATS